MLECSVYAVGTEKYHEDADQRFKEVRNGIWYFDGLAFTGTAEKEESNPNH